MTANEFLGQGAYYIYLISAVLFIFGLKQLSRVRTARRGNNLAAFAMLLAVIGTLLELKFAKGLDIDFRWILAGAIVGGVIGIVAALRVAMTSMPEMVALFNGSGGLASALVAAAVVWDQLILKDGLAPASAASNLGDGGITEAVSIVLSVLIGAVTLTGSVVAFLKLQGRLKKGAPIILPGRHVISLLLIVGAAASGIYFGFVGETADAYATGTIVLALVASILGVLLVIPIGGADMPVVVSLLNSYSGLAACAAGFVINNPLLIIAGSMVGAAGLILTNIMCVAMNRSLLNVLVGGFGVAEGASADHGEYEGVTSCDAEEAAMVLESARSVIVVPGYGLAVAQAQHVVRELADLLEARGTKVQYAIHPVAGRMPGHMNVLLAEANVPYDQLVEMDAINPEFRDTDVAIVLGANDVVNPAANNDPKSPIAGMPILDVEHARTVFVIKRSLSPGYAGIKNELFERDNTMMIFGDAKKVLNGLVNEFKELS
ncbi:MAG: NAD(P)(+) transhydrogenase (Re/Si-specific) subunit beta [Proteobacteria bacterium]|nr:NAD(P)(+) transhydrogenase (Re/Si-specific) subunit beta [Pseudomonadota bacterium]